MMRSICLIIGSLVLNSLFNPAFAQGSSGAGNGGKVIACFQKGDPQKKWVSVTPLDYWEAQQESSRIHISLGSDRLSPYEKVRLIIARIGRLDPAFAAELSGLLNQFRTLKDISNRYQINKIDDTKVVIDRSSLITPKGNCAEVQGAVQIREIDPIFNKKFFIDQEYWQLMSSNDKAGLVFHEILYWSEIKRGALDSKGTRRINAIFSSTLAGELDLMQYLQIMRRNSLRNRYSVKGATVALWTTESVAFSLSGNIAQGKLLQDHVLNRGQKQLTCLANHEVKFDDDGNIVNCQIGRLSSVLDSEFLSQKVVFTGLPISLKEIMALNTSVEFASQKWTMESFQFHSKAIDLDLSRDSSLKVVLDTNGNLSSFSSQAGGVMDKWVHESFFQFSNLTIVGALIDPTTGEPTHLEVAPVPGGLPVLTNTLNGKRYELSWKSHFDIELIKSAGGLGEIK